MRSGRPASSWSEGTPRATGRCAEKHGDININTIYLDRCYSFFHSFFHSFRSHAQDIYMAWGYCLCFFRRDGVLCLCVRSSVGLRGMVAWALPTRRWMRRSLLAHYTSCSHTPRGCWWVNAISLPIP